MILLWPLSATCYWKYPIWSLLAESNFQIAWEMCWAKHYIYHLFEVTVILQASFCCQLLNTFIFHRSNHVKLTETCFGETIFDSFGTYFHPWIYNEIHCLENIQLQLWTMLASWPPFFLCPLHSRLFFLSFFCKACPIFNFKGMNSPQVYRLKMAGAIWRQKYDSYSSRKISGGCAAHISTNSSTFLAALYIFASNTLSSSSMPWNHSCTYVEMFLKHLWFLGLPVCHCNWHLCTTKQ